MKKLQIKYVMNANLQKTTMLCSIVHFIQTYIIFIHLMYTYILYMYNSVEWNDGYENKQIAIVHEKN